MNENKNEYITQKELAMYLRLSVASLQRIRDAGKLVIPEYRTSEKSNILYKLSEVEEYMQKRSKIPTGRSKAKNTATDSIEQGKT